MCGILIAYSKQGQPVDRGRFLAALQRLGHRGPDFSDVASELDGRLLLAQSVLSISGRADSAPDRYRTSRSGRHVLAYNGEVYNHRELHARHGGGATLATGSDTEVLANLFDVLAPAEVCRQVEGMYAFAAYDRSTCELHVARDPVGEKPLFRFEDDRYLLLASELAALLEFVGALEPDAEVLREYLFTRHFMPPVRTEYRGIEKFPAGRLLAWDLQRYGCREGWSGGLETLVCARQAAELQVDMRELADRLDHELAEVLQQMLPEVPYAAIASGGIDSSLLAWYLARSGRPPERLLGLDFAALDPVARATSEFEQRLGRPIELHAVDVEAYAGAVENYYAHSRSLMPTHSLASMELLTRRVCGLGLRVLFGGDGADELFGGYAAYAEIDDVRLLASASSPSPYSAVSGLPAELASEAVWLDAHERASERSRSDWARAQACHAHLEEPAERAFASMLLLDSGTQLESVGLASSDRMGMRNSVETRSPFVHRRILRFALNLPRRARVDLAAPALAQTKPLLKRLFAERFGSALLFPKQGFPGYPNEAGRRLCGTAYPRACELLDIPSDASAALAGQRPMEWKLLNLELFLRCL